MKIIWPPLEHKDKNKILFTEPNHGDEKYTDYILVKMINKKTLSNKIYGIIFYPTITVGKHASRL